MDQKICDRFFADRTVLVVELCNQAQIAHSRGPVYFLRLVQRMKDTLQYEIRRMGGVIVKAVEHKIVAQLFAIFEEPSKAVLAAIQAHHLCQESLGFSIACGVARSLVLDMDGYNCFGDAVNMAFKLAEDVAVEDELLVMNELHEEVKLSVAAEVEDRVATVSGVTLAHKNILWKSFTRSHPSMMWRAASKICPGKVVKRAWMVGQMLQAQDGGKMPV